MDDLKELKEDVKEIRKVLTENTLKMGEYNSELRVHILGVRDLQARVKPIEDHVQFIRHTLRFIAACAAVAVTIHKLFF